MEWRPEYSVGIHEVDAQHRSLISGFSIVEKHVAAAHGWADTFYAIDELTQLARKVNEMSSKLGEPAGRISSISSTARPIRYRVARGTSIAGRLVAAHAAKGASMNP